MYTRYLYDFFCTTFYIFNNYYVFISILHRPYYYYYNTRELLIHIYNIIYIVVFY